MQFICALVGLLAAFTMPAAAVIKDLNVSPPAAVYEGSFYALFANATPVTSTDWTAARAAHDVPTVTATRLTQKSGSSDPAVVNGELRLSYTADSAGNRIPDFSHVGYHGGGVRLPVDLSAATFVVPVGANGSVVQQLIREVAKNTSISATTGYRAVIQFGAGVYDWTAPGNQVVVQGMAGFLFRGAGSDASGTIILVNESETAFFVNGGGTPYAANSERITRTVPTGSYRIYVTNSTSFVAGDQVEVMLLVDDPWKAAVGVSNPTMPTSSATVRIVTAVGADYIELDAPMYYMIFTGNVTKIRAHSTYNLGWCNMRVIRPVGDPNLGTFIDAHGSVADAFVSNVVTEYVGTLFQGSGSHSRRWTFEDCVALFAPITSTHDPDIRQMFRSYTYTEVLIHRCSQVYGRAFFGLQSTFGGSGIVISHCTDLRTWRPNYIFGAWWPGQLIEHHYSEFGTDMGANAYGNRTAVVSLIWNSYARFETGGLGVLSCTSPDNGMQNLCVGTTSSVAQDWKYVQIGIPASD